MQTPVGLLLFHNTAEYVPFVPPGLVHPLQRDSAANGAAPVVVRPSPHMVHSALAVPVLYDPTAQFAQPEVAFSANCPATQLVQPVAPAVGLVVPEPQPIHLVLSVPGVPEKP